MAESSPTNSGWLPPAAPGGRPAPRFEPQAHHGWQPPRAAGAPAAPPQREPPPQQQYATLQTPAAASGRTGGPTFVKGGAAVAGPRDGLAIASVACGAAGLGLLVVSAGLWFLVALPLSVAAWVCASRARRRIAAGHASGGAGQARTGRILGIVGVVLGLIAAAVWIYLLASGLSLDELQRDLERELERQREQTDDDGGAVRALSSLWPLLLR